ncbi:MAG: hypothetical protein GKR88_21120 [Flavobacteriaceae bacterium]|nr:MAG: hypothetical protein GKR88_21120 [Flavobacteriaceae bacterium]
MTATEITYQNFFFSGEIPCQKKATGEKKCVSALQFFNQPEGYVKNEDGKFGYVYQYKDHLGNVRLSYTDTDDSGDISQDEIVEESSYYPFGLRHRGYNNVVSSNGNSVANKYGFGGKELNEELGLEWHDFGARNYDASLGRWMNLDPLAEGMRRFSPYNYAWDNPIIFTDPDGMWGKYYAEDGTYLGDDGIDDNKVYQTTVTAYENHVDGEAVMKFGGSDFESLKSDTDTHFLGKTNEFGLIQLTGMGNENIANYGSEDKYSYTDKKGNTVAKGKHGDDWVTPEVGAAFNAAVNELNEDSSTSITVKVNDGSAFNPAKNLGHSTHFTGESIDMPFLKTNGTHSNNISNLSKADKSLNGKFVKILKGKGFTKNYSDKGSIPNTKHSKGHKDHLHVGQ